MTARGLPRNLLGLQKNEQALRHEALAIAQGSSRLLLHLDVIERAMTLAKIVVSYPQEDDDFRVIKLLSIRIFNALGSSLNLILSGYHQKGAMVMRDALETVFVMDLFRTDPSAIERWRCADKDEKKWRKEFSPVEVRKTLDARDGDETKKRAEMYKILSVLAAHPNIGSQFLLKPEKDGDILMGPFMGATILREGLDQLGDIAQRAGVIMDGFIPAEYDPGSVRESFLMVQGQWMEAFHRHVRP